MNPYHEKVYSVFPIPILAEESWFLLDEQPESPMNIWARLHFSGNYNPKKISEDNAKEFLASFVKQIESNGV
jgi:hypothetical protein